MIRYCLISILSTIILIPKCQNDDSLYQFTHIALSNFEHTIILEFFLEKFPPYFFPSFLLNKIFGVVKSFYLVSILHWLCVWFKVCFSTALKFVWPMTLLNNNIETCIINFIRSGEWSLLLWLGTNITGLPLKEIFGLISLTTLNEASNIIFCWDIVKP